MKVINLRIQNFYEQIGIDNNPIIMWQLENSLDTFFQAAYRIIISDSKTDVTVGICKTFDSGRVIFPYVA